MDVRISDTKEKITKEQERRIVEDLIERIRNRCFDKCIQKPGPELSRKESDCLAKCIDVYLETNKTVAQTVLRPRPDLDQFDDIDM
mmetsp:Transcript_10412/g.18210  ORF Transcript_10412/g.18210 Transcript_10412/m.18210 type:complete len:86 (-) Transcript_10412:982-1239(-)|eukprot:CAMPEP_0196651656 /NCGR_PEP_ID=MMETSP1086-20130531/691_1 /TAXON_ID=77921 /ORGANISM="Cyanoptyche  gloeocystis , Strain SAG4.97" /LENGTH=85 /DNA_ID=CAMNT_0041981769 /DNA_START=94 /DNA_END=351 /DNA_ORIENTATION=+